MTQTHYPTQQGLSLLELMVVIAIVGILMTIAIPNYQRYSQRAKFTEVVHATLPYKNAVNLCAYEQGDLGECGTPGKKGIPETFTAASPEKGYVATLTVGANGEVTAYSQRIKLGSLDRFSYTIKPELQDNGMLLWTVDDTQANSCVKHHLC